MSYNEVFGGATLYPAGQTYLGLTFSTDQSLQWPIEQAVAGQNVVASIMDLNATAAGLNVDIPDATQVSNGVQAIFNNVGANTITIRDAAGGTIISLVPGSAWVVYLNDNSTVAGVWRTFQLGASVAVADATALAGAGLRAISTTLNQRIAPTSTAVTPINWADADRAQLTIWTGGVGVLNLPDPATVGSDWFSMARNGGSGDLTVTPPSGTIDSAATLILSPGDSAIVVTDGTNFFTVGLGQSTTGVFDFVEINVAGSGDFTLSGVQLNRISYRFTGVLTGNRSIIVPNTVQQYWVDNSTTGAFSFFVKTAAQVTPVEILQDARNILYCDGTNVVAAESSTISFPISIVQGGTGAITAAAALANLGGVPLTRIFATPANSGLAGGGDFSADRNFTLDVNNLVALGDIAAADDLLAIYDTSAGAVRNLTPAQAKRQQIVFKNAPTPRTNNTLSNDPDLAGLSLVAGGNYRLELQLTFQTLSATAGLQLRLNFGGTASSTASVGIGSLLQATKPSEVITDFQAGLNSTDPYATTDIDTWAIQIDMTISVTATGTLDLQWAQAVTNAAATQVLENSYMILTRLD